MPGDLRVDPLPWLASAQYAPWHRHCERLGRVRLRHSFFWLVCRAFLPSTAKPPIDGASRWRVVRDITLPLLAPRLLFVTATSVAALLTSFVVPT